MPKAKSKQPNSNPTASTKTDPKVQQILDTLQDHWKMGHDIIASKLTIKVFAKENDIPEQALRTLRFRRAFYLAYKSKSEFQRFRDLRFNESKRPLDSSYVKYLLTIKTPFKKFGETVADARNGFAEHAAKNDLSPAQLHDLIKRECGRPESSHGRKYRPRDKATAIEDVAREAVKWIKRCEVAIELVRNAAETDESLLSLLKHFSQWASKAVKLCEVPISDIAQAKSRKKGMETHFVGIRESLSTCVSLLQSKKV